MTRQNFLKYVFKLYFPSKCWSFELELVYFEYHYWDQSKQERKASRLANKNEDITFFVTSASVLLLVKNTINYFSSEGLCYNLSFTHTLFIIKFTFFSGGSREGARAPLFWLKKIAEETKAS